MTRIDSDDSCRRVFVALDVTVHAWLCVRLTRSAVSPDRNSILGIVAKLNHLGTSFAARQIERGIISDSSNYR